MHSHHGHGHDHGHHHHESSSFNGAFAIAVTLTLAYTLTEAGYAIHANSMSLLADAAHNLGDTLGLALSWLANWLLSIPARKRYSYGFKRTTIIASLANAFILVATSVLIGYEAIQKLITPSAMNETVVIIVALVGIVVNISCGLLFTRGMSDLNIRTAFWHLMADALILVGVVVSAIIVAYSGWHWIDPLVALAIVAIVLFGTWGLLRDSLHLMLDAVPRYIDQRGVKNYLSSMPGVKAVHDLHIWGLSTREVALTAHLIMPELRLSDADFRRINDYMHEKFNIDHVTLQVETGSEDAPCHRLESC